jgi:hypothetical protein
MKIIILRDYDCMDNAWDSMSQHELLAELDTDEDGRTRVCVSQELLALAEREYLIVAELHRRRQMQLAA